MTESVPNEYAVTDLMGFSAPVLYSGVCVKEKLV